MTDINGTVEEMITGYRTVTAYNHQAETIRTFNETADHLTQAGIRTDVFSGIMGPIMNCIGNIGFVLVAEFGGIFAYYNMISIDIISAFNVYAKQFSRPLNEIAQIYGQIQTALAGAERVFEVLEVESENMQGEDWLPKQKTNVNFQNISFAYQKGHPIIQEFSLEVPSGKKDRTGGIDRQRQNNHCESVDAFL